MKKVIVLIFLINSILLFANDTLKYHSAYDYVINHTGNITEFFKNSVQDSTNICISLSNQIIPFDFSIFADEIVTFEYGSADSLTKIKIADSIKFKSEFNLNDIECICWDRNFKFDNKCELILFMSRIYNNKMGAELLIRHKNFSSYGIISDYGPVFTLFLFYFENDQVKEVYIKEAFR